MSLFPKLEEFSSEMVSRIKKLYCIFSAQLNFLVVTCPVELVQKSPHDLVGD